LGKGPVATQSVCHSFGCLLATSLFYNRVGQVGVSGPLRPSFFNKTCHFQIIFVIRLAFALFTGSSAFAFCPILIPLIRAGRGPLLFYLAYQTQTPSKGGRGGKVKVALMGFPRSVITYHKHLDLYFTPAVFQRTTCTDTRHALTATRNSPNLYRLGRGCAGLS
jgi:hypothetical protein